MYGKVECPSVKSCVRSLMSASLQSVMGPEPRKDFFEFGLLTNKRAYYVSLLLVRKNRCIYFGLTFF